MRKYFPPPRSPLPLFLPAPAPNAWVAPGKPAAQQAIPSRPSLPRLVAGRRFRCREHRGSARRLSVPHSRT
eukprot:91614-Chlamydomonas_euryale.AAC.1